MMFTYTLSAQELPSGANEWTVNEPFAIIGSDVTGNPGGNPGTIIVPPGTTRDEAKEKVAQLKSAFYSLVDKRAFQIPPHGTEGQGFLIKMDNGTMEKPFTVGVYKARDNRTRAQDTEQRFFWVVDDAAELNSVIGDVFHHLTVVLPRLLESWDRSASAEP